LPAAIASRTESGICSEHVEPGQGRRRVGQVAGEVSRDAKRPGQRRQRRPLRPVADDDQARGHACHCADETGQILFGPQRRNRTDDDARMARRRHVKPRQVDPIGDIGDPRQPPDIGGDSAQRFRRYNHCLALQQQPPQPDPAG